MLRRWVAGWSLRTRLVVTLVALLAVVSLAIGGITTAALREFLVSRLDEQLLPMAGMRAPTPWEPGPGAPSWSDVRVPRGFPPGTINARVVDGQVTEAWTLADRQEQAVPVDEVAALATVPRRASPPSGAVARPAGRPGTPAAPPW